MLYCTWPNVCFFIAVCLFVCFSFCCFFPLFHGLVNEQCAYCWCSSGSAISVRWHHTWCIHAYPEHHSTRRCPFVRTDCGRNKYCILKTTRGFGFCFFVLLLLLVLGFFVVFFFFFGGGGLLFFFFSSFFGKVRVSLVVFVQRNLSYKLCSFAFCRPPFPSYVVFSGP